jgi:hypothetical protein
VVISVTASPSEDTWQKYQQTFLRLYDKYPHFIVVFDLRNMGMPSLSVIDEKRKLLMKLKPRTCRQLLAAIVITSYEPVRDVIMALVSAAGQAAPFYAFTDPALAAEKAAQLAHLIKGTRGCCVPANPKALTWGRASPGLKYALVLMVFGRCIRHFLRTLQVAPSHAARAL